MTEAQQTQLTRLETRVRQLIMRLGTLLAERDALERKLRESTAREEALRRDVARLDGLYNNLKMARMLELSDDDTQRAKARLTKLVREVDSCIAMLKSNS